MKSKFKYMNKCPYIKKKNVPGYKDKETMRNFVIHRFMQLQSESQCKFVQKIVK